MADIKKLQISGQDIFPITHESAVYDSDGKSIASTGNSSRAPIVIFSGPFNMSQDTGSTSGATYQYTIDGDGGNGDVITTTTIDISSWKGLGYLNIAVSNWNYVANMKITYLEIR